MRAVIVGAGMGGLMTALALRQSGVFASVDVYEQTKVPSTAGAGLNIPPNGARICRWLGVDLDGGDSKGPDGVIDGGRAAILESTRQFNADGSVTKRPFDHVTAAGDGAGFHHMHRLDLLMCLYKRVSDFGIDSGAPCPIAVHMDCRLTQLRQTAGEVIATFSNGRTATGELLVGADGINSATLQLAWPNSRPKRWTEVTCFRGLIPRTGVASLRKANGNPLDHNPINSFSMDRHRADRSGATTYWVRGGELLNVWIAHYEPESAAFEQEEGDWFPVSQQEIVREVGEAFAGHPSRDDLIALSGAIVRPTKWGLYDRDALETWVQGRICLRGDAAHPMLPTFGQGAAQSFEDAAALASAFALQQRDVPTALLHYERVRHYRATRFQLGSKFAFDHLRAKDTAEQKALLERLDERVSPAFAHDKRGGEDDSWIYAYDARKIGSELPAKRLGPWDFRRTAKVRYGGIKLWMPANPAKGTRRVTREEVALHNTQNDCWIIISGKVYDITEWAPHHPGGAGIARMYAGKEATAEFGDYHSTEAVAHMANFCVGALVEN
ncbi:FAD-dependent monooxygenase [Bradyrhizobium sp. CW4]|uniref:cytochrome b5 domain-containing protein n=1 Tax=Bradyrhizobium sp. CW4 TaxID=2782687 RepID=UPI001FF93C03|nr:cytochrome b5 domain-containing protein [Bradyrhizobium sp. CW4]MCK1413586.1 FAD-dependent monooxygenase [Bradyrhizobium sp. CW4]MCK1413701.1 FAD-dependent monooxygenase [Bradyrhizobium sp. CW4]